MLKNNYIKYGGIALMVAAFSSYDKIGEQSLYYIATKFIVALCIGIFFAFLFTLWDNRNSKPENAS